MAVGATAMVFGGTALPCRLGLGVVIRQPEQVGPRLLPGMAVGAAASRIVLAVEAFYLGIWITPPIAGSGISTRGHAWLWPGAGASYLLAIVPARRTPSRRLAQDHPVKHPSASEGSSHAQHPTFDDHRDR